MSAFVMDKNPEKMNRAQLNATLIRLTLSLHPGSPERAALLEEFSGPYALKGAERTKRIVAILCNAYRKQETPAAGGHSPGAGVSHW